MTRRFTVGDIVPWYTGIARRKRDERLTMALQVYCDESGNNDPPVYVLAGVVGRPDDWLAFSEEWQRELDAEPPLPYFKMSDASRPTGVWRSMTSEARGARLGRFASILHRHMLFSICVVVNHDDYKEEYRGYVAPEVDDPYIFLFDSLIVRTIEVCDRQNIDGKMDFIFDSRPDKQPLMKRVEGPAVFLPPNSADRLNGDPIFRDDRDALPIQAADMVAWLVRRSVANGTRSIERCGIAGQILASKHAGASHFTRDFLVAMRSSVQAKFLADNQMTPHGTEKTRRVVGALKTAENYMKIAKARTGDEVSLDPLPATGIARFVLLHSCEFVRSPHLHRRANNECLPGTAEGEGKLEKKPLYQWGFRLSSQKG